MSPFARPFIRGGLMNILFIFSDSHNAAYTGCYGHALAETPALDRLAAAGTRFEHAYCNHPLCVPARASLFTGRYSHELGTWDNAFPWTGHAPAWPHAYKDAGVHLASIGKLDFQPDADHGLAEEILPKYRRSLDIHGLFRHEPRLPPRWQMHQDARAAGPREGLTEEKFDDYKMAQRAVEWLQRDRPLDRPWLLNVNFTMPHPSWPCPPELWKKWDARVKLDHLGAEFHERFERLHPYHRSFAHHSCGRYADIELIRRNLAAYLAHLEIMDRNVGRVLDGLAAAGLAEETLVLYASDHGENCGAHRIWSKMNLYQESIRVPLLASGPGVREGCVEHSPVSLLDVFPTCAEAQGVARPAGARGISLWGQLRGDAGAARNRFVYTEFHGNGMPGAACAVTDGRVKYVACSNARPMLFEISYDAHEMRDLAADLPDAPHTKELLAQGQAWLKEALGGETPESIDARAKRDQAALRKRMEADGTLAAEIFKRGYERRADKLVPRPEFVPAGQKPYGEPL